jgi:hypothetical protein
MARGFAIEGSGWSSVFSGFLAKMKWWRHRFLFFIFIFIFETKQIEVTCIKRRKIHPRPKRQADPKPEQAGEGQRLKEHEGE